MNLAKAKSIGRKRCRLGRLWPMPIRETDLLGVTVLESTGLWFDPKHEKLIHRLPKRKSGSKKKKKA
jgi:hypothetical protein